MIHPLRYLRDLFSDDDDGVGSDQVPDQPEAATDGGPPETGELVYECPGCGEVYLSEAPHRCSGCGETTAAVAPSDD